MNETALLQIENQIYSELNYLVDEVLSSKDGQIKLLGAQISQVRLFSHRNRHIEGIDELVSCYIRAKCDLKSPRHLQKEMVRLCIELQAILTLDEIIVLFTSFGTTTLATLDQLTPSQHELANRIHGFYQWVFRINERLHCDDVYTDMTALQVKQSWMWIESQRTTCLTILNELKKPDLQVGKVCSEVGATKNSLLVGIHKLINAAIGDCVTTYFEERTFNFDSSADLDDVLNKLRQEDAIVSYFQSLNVPAYMNTTRGGFNTFLPQASNQECVAYIEEYLKVRVHQLFYIQSIFALIDFSHKVFDAGKGQEALSVLFSMEHSDADLFASYPFSLDLPERLIKIIQGIYQYSGLIRDSFLYDEHEEQLIRQVNTTLLWFNEMRRSSMHLLSQLEFSDLRTALPVLPESELTLDSLKLAASPVIAYPREPVSLSANYPCDGAEGEYPRLLFKAVQLNHLPLLQSVRSMVSDAGSLCNTEGLNVLAYAASIGNLAMMKVLVEHYRANVKAVSGPHSLQAVHYAAINGFEESVLYLIARGVKASEVFEYKGERTSIKKIFKVAQRLNALAASGDINALITLAKQFDVDLKTVIDPETLKTPLIEAVISGQLEMVLKLVEECGCNPGRNYKGLSLLALAEEGRHEKLVEYFKGSVQSRSKLQESSSFFQSVERAELQLPQYMSQFMSVLMDNLEHMPELPIFYFFNLNPSDTQLSPQHHRIVATILRDVINSKLVANVNSILLDVHDDVVVVTTNREQFIDQQEGKDTRIYNALFSLFDDWQNSDQAIWMLKPVSSELKSEYIVLFRKIRQTLSEIDPALTLRISSAEIGGKIYLKMHRADLAHLSVLLIGTNPCEPASKPGSRLVG